MDLLTFTEEEERLIKRDQHKKVTHQMTAGRKLLALALVSFLLAHAYCESMPPKVGSMSLFPSIWTCKCGYENYDGIGSCAICGKPRGAK